MMAKKFSNQECLKQALATIRHWPASDKAVTEAVETVCDNNAVIEFLRSIPPDIHFENPDDVLTRFIEVKLFEEQEKDLPEEELRNPQDVPTRDNHRMMHKYHM